jgi:hypothetical protein
MSNEQLHIHDLTKKSICQINHCIKDFINQNHINNSQMLNGWCFDTYVTKVCLRPRGDNHVNNHVHDKIRQMNKPLNINPFDVIKHEFQLWVFTLAVVKMKSKSRYAESDG